MEVIGIIEENIQAIKNNGNILLSSIPKGKDYTNQTRRKSVKEFVLSFQDGTYKRERRLV